MEEQEMEQQIEEQKVEEPKKETSKTVISINNKNIEIGPQIINMLLAVAAAFIMIVYKICLHFGAISAGFAGVLCSVIYCLTFVGAIWAYIRNQKFSIDFGINAILFLVAIAFM